MKNLFCAFFTTIIFALPISAIAESIHGTGQPLEHSTANEGSSLYHEWVIVTDHRLPVQLLSMRPEIYISDDWQTTQHRIGYDVEISEEVSAIEFRFIPFDIWGEKGRVLSSTSIKDFETGEHSFSGIWRILSVNDAVENYAMLGYVAQVKLMSGNIIHADVNAVVKEARRFAEAFTSSDLSTSD